MDFFSSKKDGKRSGLFGKKSASKSNPATPPHPAAGRSPPPSYLSNKRAETEYDFPISREQRTYPKQPASERVPNSHPRPPVYGYGTPERRERKERMSYEPETNAPSSPFHPSGNRTPERRRKSSEYSREQQDRTYEADTRSNASPFHPFKSPSPSPYHTPDRHREHDADHYEAMYEPEANNMFQNRAPGSPFRQAGNRSPSPYRTPDRQQSEDLYERDGDVTPRNSSPPSPFHPAANRSPPPQSYRTPDRRRNHPDNQQSEEVYERDGEVTPRNSSPPSPFHPAATRSPPPQQYRTPDRRSNNHNDEQMEAMYEPDGYVMRQDSPPRSPLHGGAYYSSSDDDNHSTYLFPEIGTPTRSIPVSANTTPVHHNYQIIAAETYEQEKQYEPPELADESQSFSIQEIAKMRGLKEESQSMISESYVSVANYRVKSSVAETLQAIISKHGDIAASSKLQSNVTRSYYLESLAAVVMELRTSGLKDLTKTRVAEMAAVVKDMESVKIEVTWLKKAVAELGEAVECAGEYEAAKAEREACERDMKARKGEMEEMREELGKREKEIRECRERVTAVAGKLGQLEMKGSRLSKNLDMFHSKVDKFQGEVVLLHV
ncbi:bcl-2-associated transcription factor 1 isoform X2 [Brassica rapa]|uniref:bcl-2-associated transcription factor 1 isoform X2 n=1 Tax=Brassica campestris TaxID=3711 RepID=UPI0004F1AB4B|nr:bcl-2-associated transcription factor 1 isoform X2 [Brassica rapa]